MELIFNRKRFLATPEFRGSLSKEEYLEKYGYSSKFEIALQFKPENQWDPIIYNFMIDTGAHISIAPDVLLKKFKIKSEFEGIVYGVALKKECEVKIKMARISFRIIDDKGQESEAFHAWFGFHPYKAPFLLGLKNILEDFGISKNYKDDKLVLKI